MYRSAAMLIYEGTKDNFLISVEQDTIAVEIENNIYERMHRHTAKNEFRAWENSMEYMYKVLNDQDIPSDAGIAIEYNIPQTSKRVDFLNSAPRNVYRKKLKGSIRKSSVDNMFKGSGIYTETENNMIDTVLVDEAHRLNEKSGMFHNMGENQVKEIIHAAKCSVFFIDESQRVTLQDIGSVGEIRKWAEEENAQVTEMELVSRFRCNGSDGYLAWLDHTLEIRDTANFDMEDIDYDIRILDSPVKMQELIIERNRTSHNRARILAGYCWNWKKEGVNDPSVHDIKIGDFEISWNLKNTTTYAIDEDSVQEAGCIHTSQGLEFDYVGVIIGDDMRYENGRVVTDFTKRARTDQSLKGIKKLYKEDPERAEKEADEIIRNTYRTLMTRGMKGCYVYCTDQQLSAYLKKCLEIRKVRDNDDKGND